MRRKTWAWLQTRPGRWASRLAAAGTLALAAAFLVPALLPDAGAGLPTFEEARAAAPSSDTLLVDRSGQPLHQVRTDPARRRLAWQPLEEIAPVLRQAIVLAEDQRFFSHGGVDGLALGRALLSYGFGGRRGASTVTMQLVSLLDAPRAEQAGRRTVGEKLWQMRRAWALERRWSKAQILEAYLNLVTFRGELQGVEAATLGLLGKSSGGTTPAEAMLLAALLRGPRAAPGTVARRACQLAARDPARFSCEQARLVLANLRLDAASVPMSVSLAPHVAARIAPAAGTGRVRTTLDARLQARITELLREQVRGLQGRNVQDAAALVVDNATGEVLAYVGSAGPLSPAPAVDGVMAPRQAGSTLKPFLYGVAIERRLLTASSRLEDGPLEIASVTGLYRPQNYDRQFHGNEVTLRVALASSLNLPAVRTLNLLGADALVNVLRMVNVPALRDGQHYGPSLALGSAEVRLWDLVGAYRALAQGGRWSPLRLREGHAPAGPRTVFSPQTAFVIADILADRESRALTFGLESPLSLRFWAAVKTGTSKDMRDNWCVGFSRRYTAGVWVGNFSGAPMWNVTGMAGAAPLWSSIMSVLHENEPGRPPVPPPGLTRRGDPPEWFLQGTEPGTGGFQPAPPRNARIRYPHAGMIVAIDPDIPPARQALFLEAEGPADGLLWTVNGQVIGDANAPRPWPIGTRGVFEVGLITAEGQTVDAVRFQVRGDARRP